MAIDQPDLFTWCEVFNPVHVVTIDGGPVADDYNYLKGIVPDGDRTVAHAVRAGETRPACLSDGAQLVVPARGLRALVQCRSRRVDSCPTCAARHA